MDAEQALHWSGVHLAVAAKRHRHSVTRKSQKQRSSPCAPIINAAGEWQGLLHTRPHHAWQGVVLQVTLIKHRDMVTNTSATSYGSEQKNQ